MTIQTMLSCPTEFHIAVPPEAIRKMLVTLRNQLRRTCPSIGAWRFLIIRCRSRFLALRTRNHAVRRNTIRPILVTSPAPGTHLLPEEGAHADEECNAHNEGRHQHTQVPDHESALLSVCGFQLPFSLGLPGLLSSWTGAGLSGQQPRAPSSGLKPNGDQLAFWLIAASSPPAPPPGDISPEPALHSRSHCPAARTALRAALSRRTLPAALSRPHCCPSRTLQVAGRPPGPGRACRSGSRACRQARTSLLTW